MGASGKCCAACRDEAATSLARRFCRWLLWYISPMSETQAAAAPGTRTEQRIAWLTLVIGALVALITGILYSWSWAAGLMIGTALAWLNFRWLRKGMDALVAASVAQSRREKPRVPLGAYLRVVFRYVLIGLGVYVSFEILHVPLVSMILGLCALGAAALAASLFEVVRPADS
jgi:small-conductance mechanosensitive channel